MKIDIVIINATTNEKDNFKDELIERDFQGNIQIAPFIQKISHLGFEHIKGCALSVYSHFESNYIFIGLEGKAETIKAQYIDLSQPLMIKFRPVSSMAEPQNAQI